MAAMKLDKVGPENLEECGIGCLINRRHDGYGKKVEWLEERFDEGLRFFLFRDDNGKPLAFLEYVPGEFAWRPVRAKGWLFVHCLWVYQRGQKIGGLGSRLIQACIEEAKELDAIGVAAMVSDGAWMVSKSVFLTNGFEQLSEASRFELVGYRLKKGPAPSFCDIESRLAQYQGLHLVYSTQCPMLPKSAHDLEEMAAENGLELKITVLETARDAQNAPSYYGVYNLIWNGRLLADHYVSKGRFKNILHHDILPSQA